MTATAAYNSLVFEHTIARFEPPADFYNPNLLIATHKTAPNLQKQLAVKRRPLSSLLNSKKTDPRVSKNSNFLN
jgi:hypothetical protein